MKSKVTARGQVSIPAEIRKKFNIEPESRIMHGGRIASLS